MAVVLDVSNFLSVILYLGMLSLQHLTVLLAGRDQHAVMMRNLP